MFSCMSFCLFVSLSLCKIMLKLPKGFPETLVEGWHMGHAKFKDFGAYLDKEADPGLFKSFES